jgi:1,2-phenylacetyl-CoA epoxidase catalytic subunit/(2Fe-2S) ferredoxin
MPHFERHVFICTNRREAENPKGCCASKGSEAIRETFKKELAERGLKGSIRANAAGCLDQCGRGPTVVVYPEQTWYTVATPDDAKEIIEQHLIGGHPVDRLIMRSATDRAARAALEAKKQRQEAAGGAPAASKEVRSPSEMDGDYRAMVQQLLESQAYREVQAANLLGHALKFVPNLKFRLSIAEDLEEELEHFAEVARLYREVTGGDVAEVIQDRLSRVPYPESWTELAMAQFLYDRAGEVHLREYVGCSYVPYREIVTKILEEEEGHESFGEEVLTDLAKDERGRPELQRLFEKWLPVALLSFGRPGTPGNRYAIEVGLKTRDSSAVMQDFINDIKATMKRCGLRFPDATRIGVELFPGVDLSL